VPCRAHQVLSTPHGAREQEMQSRIRWLSARELFQDLRGLCVAATRKMNASSFERDRWLDAAATELFRKERCGFFRAIGEAKDACEFNACTDERRTFCDGAAVAVFRTLQIATRKQAPRDFKVRRRGALDRVEREVIRGLCLFVATGESQRANEHRHRGLALRIDLERRLEGSRRFLVTIEFRESEAFREAWIARGWQERSALTIELKGLVKFPDRFERPTEIEHPIATRRITRDRRAKLALGIHETTLTQHFARPIRVMFTFTCVGHSPSLLERRVEHREYAGTLAATRGFDRNARSTRVSASL